MESVDLVALETQWAKAKYAEFSAREERLKVEEEILKHIPNPGEGTLEVTPDLKVRFSLNRTVDVEALQGVWGNLTQEQQAAFKWKAEVTVTGLKKVPVDQQDALARVITVKPSKPSFSLKD